jgi:HK97 gp10 family phage protein
MPQIIGGLSKLIAELDAVGLQFTTEDLIAGAEVIEMYAMDLCPVDTGFLRDSAFLQPEANDVLIGFSAEYASYVEFGTYKMEAQPFLRPALDEAADEALSAIVDSIESHFTDITQA